VAVDVPSVQDAPHKKSRCRTVVLVKIKMHGSGYSWKACALWVPFTVTSGVPQYDELTAEKNVAFTYPTLILQQIWQSYL